MKKAILLVVTILLLSTVFSCKKVNNRTMTVVKDCTGSYLRFVGKDYSVCNLDKVAAFDNGTKVKASFRKTKDCSDTGQQIFVCMMIHKSEGWITIEKIE